MLEKWKIAFSAFNWTRAVPCAWLLFLSEMEERMRFPHNTVLLYIQKRFGTAESCRKILWVFSDITAPSPRWKRLLLLCNEGDRLTVFDKNISFWWWVVGCKKINWPRHTYGLRFAPDALATNAISNIFILNCLHFIHWLPFFILIAAVKWRRKIKGLAFTMDDTPCCNPNQTSTVFEKSLVST